MNLLIIEDNAAVRGLIRRVAAGAADEVYEWADGSEALAAYSRARPDWVLMDIEMEEMDGITATREIMALDADAKIIIVTSHDCAELREAASIAGASGYVLKDNLLDVPRLMT